MNQYNQRKEPTFGEPSAPTSDKVEAETLEPTVNETVAAQPAKLSFSLHTKTSPGHTFTPVMKRTGESAKNLSTLEEKAEQTMSNQQTPKAPNGGFSFTPVQEAQPTLTEQPKAVEPTPVEPEKTEEKVAPAASPIERVIPAAAAPAAKAVAEKVPSKYRRLLIVLLLLLALLLAFFLLKPKAPETVENLQQGSSLPIEFRPVDEEEAKRAEAQAKALQEAQVAQQAQQQADQSAPTANNTQTEQGTQPAVSNENTAVPAPQAQATETAAATPVQEQQVVAVKPVQVAVQPKPEPKVAEPKVVAPKPVVQEPAKKPTTSGSVIYQPETATKAPAPQPKVESKPQVKVETAKPAVTQPKVEAPQPKVAPVVVAEAAKVAAVSSKTMTVPKGVSLMQVFRDHNLNISDVNAMSKVNNIVSNLKVGEKITVRLDKDNRVTEMSIGSGGRFIRQANGTYIYK